MNKIDNYFVRLRDLEPVYAKKIFTTFENNLNENKNLTYAMMMLDLSKLASLSKENKKSFLNDIEKLIDSYYDEYIKNDIIL